MSLLTESRMDRTAFSTVSLFDDADDDAYWHAQTPEARLRAPELLRQINYGDDPDTARLQRLFRLLNEGQVEYLPIGGYAVSLKHLP